MKPVLHRTWTEWKTVLSGKLSQSSGYCVRTVIKPPFMNRNCLIWKQKARTRFQQKIFSMFLFNFVLHCTLNMTVPVYCLLCISSEQNCQQAQLSQKKSKGRVWTEGCHNLGVELVTELIRVQHQSRIHWFTDKDMQQPQAHNGDIRTSLLHTLKCFKVIRVYVVRQ